MKQFILMVLMCFALGLNAQTQLQELGVHNYDNIINDVWGYEANGKEYALVGVHNGFSIVDVTDPTNTEELFFWEGLASTWRDIKVWNDIAYVVTEANAGMLIVDLSDLPNSADTLATDLGGYVHTCHNVFIDENGYMYLAGYSCNNELIPADLQGGVSIFNLNDPWNPEFEGAYTDNYCHDVYVRDDIMYTSEIYAGQMGLVLVSDKANPSFLSGINTPYNFTHNVWLSDDSQYAFTTDEKGGAYIASYDVSNPYDIQFLDTWREGETNTPHNSHVLNDFQIISYYLAGIQVIDSHEPDMLVQTEHFTTTVESSGTRGCWGAYPYLPSGNILASERSGILYILGASYQRASYLQGNITNASTGNPVNSAYIVINETDIAETTGFDGNYGFGQATEGTYTVNVGAEGYLTQTVEIEFISGEIIVQDFELEPAPVINTTVLLKDAVTGEYVGNGKVNIVYYTQNFMANAPDGNLNLQDIYAGFYTITAGAWGYGTNKIAQFIGNSEPITITLEPGYHDAFFFDYEWETLSDCTQNSWMINIEPANNCITQAGGDLGCTLNDDIESDFGETIMYYNAIELSPEEPNCNASLASPLINFSTLNEPLLSFAYGSRVSQYDDGDFEDEIIVGIEWGDGEQFILEVFNTSKAQWEHKYYNLANLMETVPDEGRFIVEINSNNLVDNGLQVEFAMDDFFVREANSVVIDVEELVTDNLIKVLGNPFNESFVIELDEHFETGVIDVYNSFGQLVESQVINSKELLLGNNWPNGVYYVYLTSVGKTVSTKVVKQ